MHTGILNMTQQSLLDPAPETVLTFRHYIDYLEKRRDEAHCSKSRFFAFVIEQFRQHPELMEEVNLDDIQKYSEQLQLIYNTLAPVVEDEDLHPWALCLPLRPVVFYTTNAFFNLVSNIATGQIKNTIATKSPEEMRKQQLEFTYSLILEKCYNLPSFFNRSIIHSMADEETGRLRYYKLKLDTRFVKVIPKKPLPELSVATLQSAGHESEQILPILEQLIPLDIFRFEGFTINNVTEVTAEYAVEKIRNLLVTHSSFDDEKYYHGVVDSLKTLAGNGDIEFGLLPVLKVNNKLIFEDAVCSKSKVILASRPKGMAESTYMSLADSYFKNPKVLFYREITNEQAETKDFLKYLKQEGVASYALIPVYFNNALAGVLEVYANKKGLMDEALLSRLEPAIPLLAQLLKNSIDEFQESIDKVIKERFTSIQPSVQWKFNEVAWHYLRDNQKGDPEEISFNDVHALYGAIDIRNSTVERNAALHKDLETQFTILIEVLEKLKAKSGFGLIDAKIFQSRDWLERMKNNDFAQEMEVNDWLENELRPFLVNFRQGNDEYAAIMEEYFEAINEETGIANDNRRRLEVSMNTVITSVNRYLDNMKVEIQQAYPSYFEKFRTDGVEYDIYIGQSIAPDKNYSEIYLKNLRLLQLTSMSAIARNSHALLAELDHPVQTTQLIFIHSNAININFRKDEKRFDVEGAYNIRYHIVKKRIDKVNIKGTRERLTQPNKIALVYFNQKEADEYISYIKYLQGEKVLRDDLEYLDLEELQGVSGLRALRVGVNVE
jgi:hypothetical protein